MLTVQKQRCGQYGQVETVNQTPKLVLAAWIPEEERREQAANCKTPPGFPQASVPVASYGLHKKPVTWTVRYTGDGDAFTG